jgi:cyanate permease
MPDALIAQRDFAPSDVPRVVALVTAVNQAVFAFAPAILGVLRELSGSYALPFLIAARLQLLASMIVVLGRGLAWPLKSPERRPTRPNM